MNRITWQETCRHRPLKGSDMQVPMTREEIERRMDELARNYVETYDKEIIEELYRLARVLGEIDKL